MSQMLSLLKRIVLSNMKLERLVKKVYEPIRRGGWVFRFDPPNWEEVYKRENSTYIETIVPI